MDIVVADDLAAEVDARAPQSPLDRVEAAMVIADELATAADDLIGSFVAQARAAGCSWTEIGQRLGVSKQAARQRFGPSAASVANPPSQRRLAACLEAAASEATAAGAAEIGTDHLLIGLFAEGVAATILEKLGARADTVRAVAAELFPAAGQPAGQPPRLSDEARDAVNGAMGLASRTQAVEAGPAHLLAAVALDPGSRARRVLQRLDIAIPAVKRELACHISPVPQRRRRRGSYLAEECSFCGKPRTPDLVIVAGPKVCICAECIELAAEIVAENRARLATG